LKLDGNCSHQRNAFIGYDKSESHEGLFWCLQKALCTINDQSEGSMVPIAQINAASAAHTGRPPKSPDAPQQDGQPIAKQKGPPKTSKEFFDLYLDHSLSPLDTKVLSNQECKAVEWHRSEQ